jgi:hypothetical protein
MMVPTGEKRGEATEALTEDAKIVADVGAGSDNSSTDSRKPLGVALV